MYLKLGYLRLFLAGAVVAFHLQNAWFPASGMLAVLGFFFVSGFLISELLLTTYQGRPRDFLVNRFLRIFPAYWAALLLNVALILWIPASMKAVNPWIKIPVFEESIRENLIVFGLATNPVRLVPPAWSLDIELRWYLILFVLSFLPIWFRNAALGLAIALVGVFLLPGSDWFYGDVWGSGFAFAAGAVHYHAQPRVRRSIAIAAAALTLPLMFVLPHWLPSGLAIINSPGLSYSMLVYVALVFVSFQIFIERGTPSRMSDWAGRLSYPLFLTHFSASVLIVHIFDSAKGSPGHVSGTIVVSGLLSVLTVILVENPIANIRKRIRERNAHPAR